MKEKKRIALLSNITVDLIIHKLHDEFDFYQPDGFDTWIQEVVNPSSHIYLEKNDAVIVLLDGTEARAWSNDNEADERLAMWKQAITVLANQITNIPLFLSTVDIRENKIKSLSERKIKYELENDWYQFIQNIIESKKNVFLFDLADIISETGRNQFYSNKMWYLSSMPYSRIGLNVVAAEIRRILNSAFISRKKIITLDLDNTLWGGVAGEDGLEGIELSNHKEGQRYYDFQKQLLEMKNRGVILALNSKNNVEDAEEIIQKHPSMLLRDEDFVTKRINWENKAENIKSIEDELNLTEGGFIFIDDNPMERETIKNSCDEILVPDFPSDTAELIAFAENIWFDYCRPLRVLDEDKRKTQMYQTEAKRRDELHNSLDLDEFIAKLEIIVDIHRIRSEELERVTQLVNKTNQFNVTTKRYSKAELEKIINDPNNQVYVVYSSDKYGDNGLISTIILMKKDTHYYIDTFVMSCRVMGRKLENVIINEIASNNQLPIYAEYVPTNKNIPVKDLYERTGFILINDENGHKTYEMKTRDSISVNYSSFKQIIFEG